MLNGLLSPLTVIQFLFLLMSVNGNAVGFVRGAWRFSLISLPCASWEWDRLVFGFSGGSHRLGPPA